MLVYHQFKNLYTRCKDTQAAATTASGINNQTPMRMELEYQPSMVGRTLVKVCFLEQGVVKKVVPSCLSPEIHQRMQSSTDILSNRGEWNSQKRASVSRRK